MLIIDVLLAYPAQARFYGHALAFAVLAVHFMQLIPFTLAVVSVEERKVLAYDCSAPSWMEPVQEATTTHCKGGDPIKEKVPVIMRLLQRATYTEIKVKKCTWTSTITTVFCGNYDHETSMAAKSTVQQNSYVTIEGCKKFHSDLFWEDKHTAQIEPLRKNGNTHFLRQLVGSYVIEDGHVDCIGGTLAIPGRPVLTDVTQVEHVTILLEEMPANVHNVKGEVTVLGTVLGGNVVDGGSVGGTGTYTWTDVDVTRAKTCHMYNPKEDLDANGDRGNGDIEGELITTEEGQEWFQGHSKSHVKLRLKSAITECGRTVHPTNFAILFVTRDLELKAFARPLPTAEMSPSTHMNQQDAFVHDVLKDELHRSLTETIEFVCKSDELHRRTRYAQIAAERSAALDGETVGLGDGWFITRAGDGWHRYLCRSFYAEAVNIGQCFSGLPVKLSEDDLARYQRVNYLGPAEKHRAGQTAPMSDVVVVEGTEKNVSAVRKPYGYEPDHAVERQFFITPVSHRLTLAGGPRPCVPHMPGIYRNSNGRWLGVNPQIQLLHKVTVVDNNITVPEFKALANFDAEGGGIYSAADLRLQEEMQQVPRWKDDLSTKMARTVMHDPTYDQNSNDDRQVFRKMPALGLDVLAGFWALLDRLASMMAVLLGFMALVKLGTGTCGCCLRCFAVWEQFGCGPGLCVAAAPSWLSVTGAQRRVAGWYWRNRRYNPQDNGRYPHGHGKEADMELGLPASSRHCSRGGLGPAPSAPARGRGWAEVDYTMEREHIRPMQSRWAEAARQTRTLGRHGYEAAEQGGRLALATSAAIPGARAAYDHGREAVAVVTRQPAVAAVHETGVRFSNLLRQSRARDTDATTETDGGRSDSTTRSARLRRFQERRDARRASKKEYPDLPVPSDSDRHPATTDAEAPKRE